MNQAQRKDCLPQSCRSVAPKLAPEGSGSCRKAAPLGQVWGNKAGAGRQQPMRNVGETSECEFIRVESRQSGVTQPHLGSITMTDGGSWAVWLRLKHGYANTPPNFEPAARCVSAPWPTKNARCLDFVTMERSLMAFVNFLYRAFSDSGGRAILCRFVFQYVE